MKLKTKFQDEDFELGEVADVNIATMPDGRIKAQAVAKSGGVHTFFYDDLKTFTDDWEDYEDELFYIVSAEHKDGYICALKEDYKELCDVAKKLGIGFETEKEARQAVEKLKAWKRLKDDGFTIRQWRHTPDMNLSTGSFINIKGFIPEVVKNIKDLDLLFGSE